MSHTDCITVGSERRKKGDVCGSERRGKKEVYGSERRGKNVYGVPRVSMVMWGEMRGVLKGDFIIF